MTDYLCDPPSQPSRPIRGSVSRFPVHRIYCVGRNYAAHAIEMGHDPDREEPFFFAKHPGNLVTDGGDFPDPPQSSDVHHEIEMVVALKTGGVDIPLAEAMDCIFGYAVGLDMTRRDLQGQAKKAGRPWDLGKAFEHSAPCGELVSVEEVGHPAAGEVVLKVNGEMRQHGDLNQLIWKVPEMISYLSRYFELRPGDLIFSGTPAGVGPVERGDRLEARVAGVGELNLSVV